MDLPAKFFLVIAAAAVAPLLSEAQPLYGSTAKPPMSWTNSDAQFSSSLVRPILTDVVDYREFNFGAGFLCATAPTCGGEYVFAVFIISNVGGTLSDVYPRQVVWSANRDRPVRENATLEFTLDGDLLLRDADGSHVWSSGSSGRSVADMVIGDGNLVLSDQTKAIVWQSFEHPTDTLVLGQPLVEGMMLTTSSASPQLYFSYRTKIGKTRNDPLTRATFMDGSLSFMLGLGRIENITLPTTVSTQYMRLDSDGYLRLYEWSWSNQSWTMVYDILGSLGMDACAYPAVGGEYGVCTGGRCICPLTNSSGSSYFKQVDERKPNLGCTPLTPVSCQEIQHHQLMTVPNISYYDNYTNVDAINNKETTIDGCKQACLKNCSCMAVLFRGGECVWVTKVFSMQSIKNGTTGYESSAYLKVQLSLSNENKTNAQHEPSNDNRKVVMLAATLGAVTTLVLLIIAVVLYLQKRRKYEEKDEEFDFDQLPGMPTRFSFEMLRECTEGFSKKLGEGGFGSVFEGKLGAERVAVKRLEGARQGKKEFLAEVETIGSIEHINLVKLIGFCAERSERLLVYEYMNICQEGHLIDGTITTITMALLIGAPGVGSFWILPRAYATFMRSVGGKSLTWISNHKIFSWMTTLMPK